MAYKQLLSVSVYRYKDGTTRPSIWINRFDRRAWETAGKGTPALDHIVSKRYTWNSRNLRRIVAAMPKTFELVERSIGDIWRSTWRISPDDRIVGTDW